MPLLNVGNTQPLAHDVAAMVMGMRVPVNPTAGGGTGEREAQQVRRSAGPDGRLDHGQDQRGYPRARVYV